MPASPTSAVKTQDSTAVAPSLEIGMVGRFPVAKERKALATDDDGIVTITGRP